MTPDGNSPLGILGGTFDPVHNAHLQLAAEAMGQLPLGGVLWIPAGRPSHRGVPVAEATHRLAMVRLATAGYPDYSVDTAEIASTEPSYTVPTLERLRAIHGARRPLVLLMGADAFLGLASWHRWLELFDLAHLAVVSRPSFDLAAEHMPAALAAEFGRRHRTDRQSLAMTSAGSLFTFTMDAGTLSSTAVRAALAAGEDAAELLPAPVVDYISAHRLYRP